MKEITICVGSSCHLKGAYQIVERFRDLVANNNLETEINLGASFCQGHCTQGVVIKIDQEVITNVSPENVEDIFYRKLQEEE